MMNSKAIQSLRPNAEFTMTDDDPQTVIWHTEGVTTPTQQEINAEIKRLEEAEAADIVARADAKASALSKLQALGLTEEEAKAITTN
jgi:hypothetical protein